jgi:tetratricopeptide (TPR) repeat protein
MGVHLERALVLFEQSRFELAEEELRQDLAAEPDNAAALALLGLCLAEREEYRQATWAAQEAVTHDPESPFAYYALASIMQDREFLDDALQAIEEAIRLDPKHTNYLALLSSIRFDQSRWHDALAAAEQGLRLDPEHSACANLRAMALSKLGRMVEARSAIESALATDPLNAVTRANQGWTDLLRGDTTGALEHFREALRLDADFAMARQGIVESLKSRYLVYRLLLRFMLWMGSLNRRAQWGIILGGAVGYVTLLGIEDSYPDLAPWIWPALLLYLGFGVITWIADPLFNLLLRLDRFGRLAMTPVQHTASTWVGVCLLGAVLLATIGLVANSWKIGLVMGAFGLLVLPVARIFDCQPGWPRAAMATYALGLAGFWAASVALLMTAFRVAETDRGLYSTYHDVGLGALGIFVAGAFLSSVVSLALVVYKPKL